MLKACNNIVLSLLMVGSRIVLMLLLLVEILLLNCSNVFMNLLLVGSHGISKAGLLMVRRGRSRGCRTKDAQRFSTGEAQTRQHRSDHGGCSTSHTDHSRKTIRFVGVIERDRITCLLTGSQHASTVFDSSREVERYLLVLLKHLLDDLVGMNSAMNALTILQAIVDDLLG